jgi:hypothetical protein
VKFQIGVKAALRSGCKDAAFFSMGARNYGDTLDKSPKHADSAKASETELKTPPRTLSEISRGRSRRR